MIELTWAGKQPLPPPAAAHLHLESILHLQPVAASQAESSPPAEGRLFWGDNLAVMAALLPEWEGRINLIYADPPFFTNRKFNARIGRGEDSRKPNEWRLAEGYADSWKNLDDYLQFLYERLSLMHRLLAPTGSLYLHLDWHADAYARLLLDEIFGPDRLLNEIAWVYHGPSPIRSAFNRKHDTLLAYTKSDQYTFNADAIRIPYDPNTLKTFASSSKAGFGKTPDLQRGKVPEDWWYFPVVARLHRERTGYPTQKPEALLERIILASSNSGDVVADFFCGSGTTPLAAARQKRNFLAADSSWRALQTTRARFISAQVNSSTGLWLETPPPVLKPGFEYHLQAGQILLSGQTDSLIFWEVDPDFDRQTFHSRLQATRPLRGGFLPLGLPIGNKKPAGQICLRALTAEGEQVQAIIEG